MEDAIRTVGETLRRPYASTMDSTQAVTPDTAGPEVPPNDDISSVGALISIVVSVLIGGGVAWLGGAPSQPIAGWTPIVWCTLAALGIQWIAYIPAYLNRTEHFYDLVGGLTYLTVTLLALWLAPEVTPRAAIMAGLVIIWAGRLASFLFRRVRKAGSDSRFATVIHDPIRFLLWWTLQGLWVSLTLAATLATITFASPAPIGALDILGVVIWVFGFSVEAVADRQKAAFRADPSNQGQFIRTGLWAWSRHPNYFGEITLWIGMALIATSSLTGLAWVTLISPVFVTVLLTRISGLPMLEASADRRWGGQPEYEEYKARTPVLILVRPR